MATEELGDGLTSDQESLARQAQNLLTHAIRTMRSLTFELASAALYDVGLGAAMQSLCDRAQEKSGIEFQPPQILPGNPIPEPTRVILYRAGRELIQNVVKHSQARTAKLALTLADDVIRLCVRDDGCGFDVEKLRDEWQVNRNFGLFSITQQLQPLGGELEIVSTPGSGTRATLIVPLALEKAAI
jgi:signal transduction histidine kinase